ncbi:flavonol 7-O-beta-glucosyltransferase UGT74F1-like [Ziziphus jujuba]|uniref:Flavonol 7-O-beta-glucosyltransferase UGT74F1-like n=1 Tax=Ziziphus jujuba TaxID=326968 RepID=A0ABM3ZWI5_ZIZJJ|nr:flavonol 7-O-beta-glucosyltransferase UGT74F1-like [Ziziphus jujuba]
MSKVFPSTLTIGPTIPSAYLNNKHMRVKFKDDDKDYGFNLFESEASGVCKEWLNKKPVGSVVYVSFGSMANLSVKQIEELSMGLKASNMYFLWVIRPFEQEKLRDKFGEDDDKGLLVKWCPQLEVLANEAVGCFFTHCGWNSAMEGLSLGVPMVAMPQWTNQTTNAKIVEGVWKVGVRVRVDENGIVGRHEISGCIRQVMKGERAKEIKYNANKWRNIAIRAIRDGSSSDNNMTDLYPN